MPTPRRSLSSGVREAGVEGNARLTGGAGALIFVLLAIEGVTLLGARRLVSVHVFVGMLLVPVVALKVASTVYRLTRYYRGVPEYLARGHPPLVLRLAGPVVIASTVAVFATGIAALAVGPSSQWVLQAHKASFIVWFGVTAVHVLGHILETPGLAVADWHRRRPRLRGTATRRAMLVGTLAAGLTLGLFSLGWVGPWHQASGRG